MARPRRFPPVAALDHLHLSDADRGLIRQAAPGADRIYLSPLDKGLSGARVWLAQWEANGVKTKLHVFKIGDYDKLGRERDAAKTIASPLEDRFPDMVLFPDKRPSPTKAGRRGLLRQEFLGRASGDVMNLRRWIVEEASDAAAVRRKVDEIYEKRMKRWHPANNSGFRSNTVSLRQALDRWGAGTLLKPAGQIGRDELDCSLTEMTGSDLEAIVECCVSLRKKRESFCVGPVHGDLHSQNVLVNGDCIELIDFGLTGAQKWRALDFLMLECSLKFLVAPPHARLRDLIAIDELTEPALDGDKCAIDSMRTSLLGRDLEKIAAGVAAVRKQALRTNAVSDGDQYRRGLVLMTAGLAELPEPINRVYLFHSLAWHVVRAC